MKQHKWHKEIKAWADGEEIECNLRETLTGKWDGWFLESEPNWCANENYKFRIKPQTKEKDWVMICKKCGDELGIVYEPEDEIGDAEIKQMLNDIEYYQKRVEELEEQCEQLKTTIAKFRKIEDEYAQEPRHVGGAWIHKDGSIWEFDPLKSGEETLGMDYVKLYTHPKQPLSNDELKAIQDNTWVIQPSDMREFNTFKFARAIEQAHGIGEDNEI